MEVFEDSESMYKSVLSARCNGEQVGFVPTMGALHEGHLSLIRRSVRENDRTAISCYVNARQFDTDGDAEAYPREFEKDRELAAEEGVDLIFHPDDSEMYPPGEATEVISSSPVTRCYEGTIRPNFFDGVTTVVTKLLNSVPADRVYFGQKDLQQYVVVQRMVEDLGFSHEIVPAPVARDENGIAYSSRNRRLDSKGWEVASATYKLMDEIRASAGELTRQEIFQGYVPKFESAGLDLQYLDVVRFPNFDPAWPADEDSILILAGYAGEVRLKDNLPLHVESVAELEEN